MKRVIVADTDHDYPVSLKERLKADAPNHLTALGNLDLLAQPRIALFCSTIIPGDAILRTHDQAAKWRDEGRCVISGFHSPIEKECFDILLRGKQPIIIVLARGLEGMRLPSAWKRPLFDNHLLVLSGFPATAKRVNKHLAIERNRIAAALADQIHFAHIAPGGQLAELHKLVQLWGIPTQPTSSG